MAVSLDSDVLQELNSPEAQHLHNLTKELSRTGVGSIVDLPQIVVFGGQNAGKSSVLEAISHIRFPIDSGLCTRFATELELKHAAEPRIRASVKFADDRGSKSLSYDGFQESDLPEIIQKAKEEMGLAGSDKGFTKDVLRLKIEGPSMYPLQLVDLPGVFSVTSADQTEKDIETVTDLVDGYLRQKNSIIMLVIAAETDYHNQLTLKRLKKFDESGKRTIGVITKPDKAESDHIRKPYIMLASNQQSDFKLDLGWHVMRNRDTKDETDDFAARDAAETRFFEESSWAAIPRTDRGVNALRVRLSKIQFDHLRRSIPGITQEMKTKLAEREEELDRLGTARSEIGDIRNFLNKKADAFQQLAKEAVEGRYHEAFFRRSPDQYKLRAQLRNFSAAFDYTLRAKGAERKVIEDEKDSVSESDLPKYLEDFLGVNPYPFADTKKCTFAELSAELNEEAAKTRGLEFPGSTNDNLALRLFQRQSHKWGDIAQHHIEMVTTSARLFVEKAMEYLIGAAETDHTTDAILRTIVDDFFEEREDVLKEKLEELFRPYREAYALPVDGEFIALKTVKSIARQKKEIMDQYCEVPPSTSSAETLGMLLAGVSGRKEGEFAPGGVLDAMETYYELSRRTFTDNIVNLAVESCLVRRIPYIFTPTSVGEMSDATVKELAAESEHVRARREDLVKETAKLREALKYCNRYKPRISLSKMDRPTEEPTARKTTPAVAERNTTAPGTNDPRASTTALFQSYRAPGEKTTAPAPTSSIFGRPQPNPAASGAASDAQRPATLFASARAEATSKAPLPSPASIFAPPKPGTTPNSGPTASSIFNNASSAQSSDGSAFRMPPSWGAAPSVLNNNFGSSSIFDRRT